MQTHTNPTLTHSTTSHSTAQAKAALAYAKSFGWHVLPLHGVNGGSCTCSNPACDRQGKHPRTQNGVKDASADPAIIAGWWARWPDANIGIAAGASGFWVLDVDGEAGEESLKELEAKQGKLPDTVEQLTGGGGRHMLFKRPAAGMPNKVKFAPGLDSRGDDGYIVVAPSIHKSGRRYEWEVSSRPGEVTLADAPEWLPNMIKSNHIAAGTKPAQDWTADIPEGQRNAKLTSRAGFLFAQKMPAAEVMTMMWITNVNHCKPPLPEAEVAAIVASIGKREAAKEQGETEDKRTQAQILIALAAGAELFHTPDENGYATFNVDGHKETWPIRSGGFRRWLVRQFYEVQSKPPGAQALQDALSVLEAQAHYDGRGLPVFTRLAGADGRIYIDICNDAWEAVEVTPSGWRVVSDVPVKFRRAKGMLPLPIPEAGGSLTYLRRFVNISGEADWCLLVAWVIAALRPRGPYPVLNLNGEHGSAKSTLVRVLRALIDPAVAPMRTAPRDERDLAIAACNTWVTSYDNLSGLPLWLSDALCRLSTGGGHATRTLYSDDEETIFDYMRPAVINGIDEVVTRHDLLDRSLLLTLPVIPETERRDEDTFWADFEQARPLILGALLDAVAVGLRNINTIKLATLPRMADFAKWVAACEPALPWEANAFLAAYAGKRTEAVETALEADAVAVAVKMLLAETRTWEGTATELLTELEKYVNENAIRSKSWPKSARGLTNRLRRAATFLRQVGVEVEFAREENASRRRLIRINTQSIVHNVHNVHNVQETHTPQGFEGWTQKWTQNDFGRKTSSKDILSSKEEAANANGLDDMDEVDAKKHSFYGWHVQQDNDEELPF